MLRAMVRELARCKAEKESWSVSRRIEADDRLGFEVLKLLSDDEKKACGL